MRPLHPSITFFLLLSASIVAAQTPKEQQQAILLKRMIELNHYAPRAVNDSFSAQVFSSFIEALDPQHFLFLTEDYNRLATFRLKLDEEVSGRSWGLLDAALPLYRQALKRHDSLATVTLQKPLDWNKDEIVTYTREKAPGYAASLKDLAAVWGKWLKLQLLYHAYTASEGGATPLRETLVKNEAALRKKIEKSLKAQGTDDNPAATVRDAYLAAIASAFDPHTAFFSPDEKADFESSLSTEQASFGFSVGDKDGKLIIEHLLPGGPAWKSGELHRNDQLVSLKFGTKEALDATLLSAEEVDELLAGADASVVVKVKKATGLTKELALKKEKIETEENSVKGYVLKGEKKLGYISLPDFYTTWEGGSGSGCANDVAKAIMHLKKEAIEALIVDVRYNGGGSLEEALELAGIFIEEGPLLGVKERSGKISFLKDPNRGTIYDGPMVLLVNGQSASASEMLAATLQDYNRAVIVGSASYGKATMQSIYPMDSTTSNRMVTSPNGYVKITNGKLYRLNGATAQQLGVVPDIHLPDLFDALEYKEKFLPAVLPADSVKRNAYYKPLGALPIAALAAASAGRLAAHTEFAAIKGGLKPFGDRMNGKEEAISLKPETFVKWAKSREAFEKLAALTETGSGVRFAVANHSHDAQRLQGNPYAAELNAVIMKNLQSDLYIEEAMRILADLINLKTSK